MARRGLVWAVIFVLCFGLAGSNCDDEPPTGGGADTGPTDDTGDGGETPDTGDASDDARPDGDDTAVEDVPDDSDDVAPPAPPVLDTLTEVLDFGRWSCGQPAPAAASFTVTNPGGTTANYRVELRGEADWFEIVEAGPGVIEPGGEITVTVRPSWPLTPYQPIRTHVADVAVLGLGQTTGGDTVGATVEVGGAEVGGGYDFVRGGDFDLGQVAVGRSAEATTHYTVSPLSSDNVTLSFQATADDAVIFAWEGSPDPVTLGPGESVAVRATVTPGSAGGLGATLTPTFAGAICSDTAVPFTVRAQGTDSDLVVSGSLDFGATPCNGQATARTITLENVGAGAVAFGASLVSGERYRVDPTSGTIPAHGTATLTVTPTAPMAVGREARGSAFDDVLTVTTDLPGGERRAIPVRQRATGATIVLASPFGHELVAAAGQAVEDSVLLYNTGTDGYAARLYSTDPDLSFPGGDTVTVPAGGVARLPLRYTANLAEARSTAVWLDSTGAGLCNGASENVLSFFVRPLTGSTGTVGDLVFPRQITLRTLCGDTAAPVQIPIYNPTIHAILLSGHLEGDDGYTLRLAGAPWTDVIAVGAQQTLIAEVVPPPMGRVARLVRQTGLVLETTDPASVATIGIRESSHGYALRWQSPSADLGAWPAGGAVDLSPRLINDGTMPVDATVTTAPGGATGTAWLLPGAEAAFDLRVNHLPAGDSVIWASVSVNSQGNHACAEDEVPLPARLTVRGTIGELAVSPSTLDFGDMWCHGAAAGPQLVSVHNGGGAAFTFTTGLSAGGRFAVSPETGTVGAGETATLVVTPLPILDASPGPFTDVLSVSTDTPAAQPQQVRLTATVRGAVIEARPDLNPPPSLPVGELSFFPLWVVLEDVGLEDVELEISPAGDEFRLVAIPDDRNLIEAFENDYRGLPLTLIAATPASLGLRTATVIVRAADGASFCQPPVAAIAVSVLGVSGRPPIASPQPLDLGETRCGEPNAGGTLHVFPAIGQALEGQTYQVEVEPNSTLVVLPERGEAPSGIRSVPVRVTRAAVAEDLEVRRIQGSPHREPFAATFRWTQSNFEGYVPIHVRGTSVGAAHHVGGDRFSIDGDRATWITTFESTGREVTHHDDASGNDYTTWVMDYRAMLLDGGACTTVEIPCLFSGDCRMQTFRSTCEPVGDPAALVQVWAEAQPSATNLCSPTGLVRELRPAR